MNKSLPFLYTASILLLSILPFSENRGQELPSEEVQVIKNFNARLAKAERLALNPQLPPFDTATLDYDFEVNQRTVSHSYEAPPIRAIGLGNAPKVNAYNGYARAGYGLPQSPYGRLHYGYDNQDQFAFQLDGRHYSLNNNVNLTHQFVMENEADASLKWVASDALALTAKAGFSFNRYDLYGYDHNVDSFSNEEARRSFTTYSGGLGLKNPNRNKIALDYSLDVGFRNHRANDFGSENTIMANANLTKWMNDKNPLRLDIDFYQSIYTEGPKELQLSNINLTPSYSFFQDNWSAKVGLTASFSGDSTYLFPDLMLQARLIDQRLIAFLGAGGGLSPQDFHALSSTNPYLHTNLDTLFNTRTIDIYGGIKGAINRLNYEARISYQLVNDMVFFNPNLLDTRTFLPIRDDGSIVELGISGSYQVNEQLHIDASLTQQFFSLDSLEAAFHVPSFSVDSRVTYDFPQTELRIWGGVRFQNGVPYYNEMLEVDRLGALFDLSLGVDYYFSEHFGIWVHAYNLANNTRQRWERYPIFGTNILGGLLVRF